MPAITRSQLYNDIKAGCPKDYTHPNFTQLLSAVSEAVSTAWSSFHNSLRYGNLLVNGLGFPTWEGDGSADGKLTGAAWTIKIKPDFTAPMHVTFCEVLSAVLNQELDQWLPTFNFNYPVHYSGTSTATPTTPGVFTATQSTALTIQTGGNSKEIINLKTPIEARLTSKEFKLSDSGLQPVIQAIALAVEKNFKLWRNSSKMVGNSITGASAAGTGSGVGNTLMNGTIT